MKQAFFLDRDGVVNVEVDYLSDPDKAELIPRVPEALREIHAHGFLAIVVTNQSGVARGMYTETEVRAVHRRLDDLLAAGMLLRAAREHEIDLANSVMVGDRLSDLEAGRAAGCRTVWLVKTGYGAEVVRTADLTGINVATDLADAVRRTFAGEE